MEGWYEIGAVITGISVIGRGVPWLVRDWRSDPPELPGDWTSAGFVLMAGLWMGTAVLLTSCVLWPVTWAGFFRWRQMRRRQLRTEERETVRFLLGKVRHATDQ